MGTFITSESFEDFEVCWSVVLYICVFVCLFAHSRSTVWS